jgi:hypothetical protein
VLKWDDVAAAQQAHRGLRPIVARRGDTTDPSVSVPTRRTWLVDAATPSRNCWCCGPARHGCGSGGRGCPVDHRARGPEIGPLHQAGFGPRSTAPAARSFSNKMKASCFTLCPTARASLVIIWSLLSQRNLNQHQCRIVSVPVCFAPLVQLIGNLQCIGLVPMMPGASVPARSISLMRARYFSLRLRAVSVPHIKRSQKLRHRSLRDVG